MGNPISRFNVKFVAVDWIVPFWWKVAYLIINDGIGGIANKFKNPIDAKFNELVTTYLQAYVNENKMPPAEIAPAIMNLADDFAAGREMTIRAGDYIAIQGFMRQGKK
ncbi:MAG TPA: hypothetical protein VKF36_20600 [Syntrophorhabdales bacterium]|nr:hypothetical protein [Syntrophorhabdales bacterium]